MEVFRFGIYLSVILFVVFHSDLVKAAKEVSALVLQVQSVPNGVSSAKLIECAFHLMKSSNSSFVRIPEGGDNCEQLARPSSINSKFIEKEFEYLEKSAFYRVFDQKTSFENSYNQIYQHYIYQEVKVGDKFHFVFQKSNTDRLTITFRDTTNTIQAVKFNDNSTQLVLTNVGLSGQNENEKLASPLQDFKIYKIRFEILQYHWKITVNDEVLPTINHHGLIKNIEVIVVRLGPSIKYLSKYFNPRNQPTGITGW